MLPPNTHSRSRASISALQAPAVLVRPCEPWIADTEAIFQRTPWISCTLSSFPLLIMSGSSGPGVVARGLWASYLLSETSFLLWKAYRKDKYPLLCVCLEGTHLSAHNMDF